MSLHIPVVETDRLVLRGWSEDDLDAYTGVVSDPEVMRWYPRTETRAEAWRGIAGFLGHWVLRGYGQWALELKETGELVGRAGLYHPEGWPGVEVGWMLAHRHWGRGYATEAGAAAVAFARERLKVDRLVSVIRPENEPSWRVAQRLGFTPGEPFLHAGYDHVVWELARARAAL